MLLTVSELMLLCQQRESFNSSASPSLHVFLEIRRKSNNSTRGLEERFGCQPHTNRILWHPSPYQSLHQDPQATLATYSHLPFRPRQARALG